ncbi:MAG: ATP-binding cassette domain-containing protein, partial [Bradyrhizobiaceae bacterium]|nr:ATP-binding cassette domain-containing protein [Bradyrhizobiaceae bacterium]
MQRSRPRRRLTDVPFIQVENLTRVFDVSRPWLERLTQRIPRQYLVAAANVTFAIGRRETFGLVGESGSGKSTIARVIVGLIPPSGGSVEIDGTRVTDRAQGPARQQARRRIQMVFQDPYSS